MAHCHKLIQLIHMSGYWMKKRRREREEWNRATWGEKSQKALQKKKKKFGGKWKNQNCEKERETTKKRKNHLSYWKIGLNNWLTCVRYDGADPILQVSKSGVFNSFQTFSSEYVKVVSPQAIYTKENPSLVKRQKISSKSPKPLSLCFTRLSFDKNRLNRSISSIQKRLNYRLSSKDDGN